MSESRFLAVTVVLLLVFAGASVAVGGGKPGQEDALALLKAGNQRFSTGTNLNPNIGPERLVQAGKVDQADYAYATVLACSDSRVPVSRIFDAGVMDIFTVRVAGNVCTPGVLGSLEYGVLHVRTPVLVVLGHSQCGAVTAALSQYQGHGHALERNIPTLLNLIMPAVKRVMARSPGLPRAQAVEAGVVQNVWQAVHDCLLYSPAIRQAVRDNMVLIKGAVYGVGTGEVRWLPQTGVDDQLSAVLNHLTPTRRGMAQVPAPAKPGAAE